MLNSIERKHESRKEEVEVEGPSLTITFRHTGGIYTSCSCNFSLHGSECPGSHKEVNSIRHIVRASLNVKLQLSPLSTFEAASAHRAVDTQKVGILAWQESLALMIMRR